MTLMNRLNVAFNRFQGNTRKVLTVCSAGILRSPTAAHLLASEPFNFNTRSAGVSAEYAFIPVDQVLLEWADDILCMEQWQADEIKSSLDAFGLGAKEVKVLNIPDQFPYRDPKLVKLLMDQFRDLYPNYFVCEQESVDSPV